MSNVRLTDTPVVGPRDAVATCVDRTMRRDSQVEFWVSSDREWVRKSYHSKYSIAVEVEAYQVLREIVCGLERVRTPEIYDVNWKSNSMDIEFVRGRAVAHDVVVHRLLTERSLTERLLRILIKARRMQAQVDLDPQNIIIADASGDLVIIDPVWHAEELPDGCAVVFFVGLLKCLCRDFYRVGDARAFVHAWTGLKREYLERSGTKDTSFDSQVARYIDAVVAWNREPSERESLLRRMWRRTVLVPFWLMLASLFRSRAARVVRRAGLKR